MTIYVVRGASGEFSDRSEWPVRAYLTMREAEAHVTRAEAFARDHGLKGGYRGGSAKLGETQALASKLGIDPTLEADNHGGTGTYYFIEQVEFLLSAP